MEPNSEPFDVKILLVGGSTVETVIEEHNSIIDVLAFLKANAGRYPGWVMLGDVVVYSQNIIAIQPVYEEDE